MLMNIEEPTAALGVPEQLRVLELIRTLRKHGVPVILMSHNMQDVFAVADRVIVMRRGSKAGERKISGTNENEVVFFFQAEDGIRDYKVTGVQTCALPISAPQPSPATAK